MSVEFEEKKSISTVTPENVSKQPEKKSLKDLYTKTSEEVRIPSNGLVYSNATGIMNKQYIPMRVMLATDEDDLTSPTLLRQGKWLTKILANCLTSKLIDPEELLVGDRNALLFWLRQTAYGSSYDLNVTCPNCDCAKKSFRNEFKLNKLELKTLDVKPIAEGKNEFEFILPLANARVIFSLLTSKMSDEITQEEDTIKDRLITTILKKQIIEIDGVRDRKELDDFIDNGLAAKDSLALRHHIEKITPDIILKQKAICPHSGKTQEFPIPIEAQFFLPTATA